MTLQANWRPGASISSGCLVSYPLQIYGQKIRRDLGSRCLVKKSDKEGDHGDGHEDH